MFNTMSYAKSYILVKHAVFTEHVRAKQLGSNAFITGPSRYRKVEEIYRKKSDKSLMSFS